MKLNLYYERVECGWSQALIAGLLGISQSYYCLIETGKRNPSLSLIEKLESLFDKPYNYLLKERISEIEVEKGEGQK